ncbi:glycosyltransferase family 4 protein [Bacillus sp. NEB1478]|uniref:glycosyltransferase family 4 protein n=1 Tax=Bacillus sp. NEB1478 TaxID=3073816 RepID=UPI002873D90D|nr:glycosyltransferase family 4 protein [Bacillus sp. NEB1478]WNB92503.1 glycosyltransferase family 4 protein [Bacillus sp. NEB1478]
MKKKRIVFIDHAKEMGGAEHSLYYLIKYLDYERFIPILISPTNSELSKKIINDIKNFKEVKIIHIEQDSIKKLPLFLVDIIKICKIIKGLKIDIVHVNTYRSAIYGLISAKITRVKSIWHVRDFYKSRMFKTFFYFLSDKVITISKAVEKQFPHTGKCQTIFNAIDFSVFNFELTSSNLRKELNIDEKTVLIGMIGRLNRWKGFHHMIEAIPIIKKYIDDFRLIIVGDEILTGEKGYLNELHYRVNQLKISENVYFLGQRKDIPNIMKSLDVVVNYSKNEPFGRVIIESLAMGTSVVVANSGGAPEIIINSPKCGLIAECSNPSSLAIAIVNVLQNKTQTDEKYKIMYTKKNFHISQHVNSVMNIYNEI